MIRLFGSRREDHLRAAHRRPARERLQRRRLVLLFAGLVAALVSRAPRASANAAGMVAAGPVIAVLGVGPPNLPADLRRRVEDAAAAGLKASGAELRSPGSPGLEYGVRGDLTVDGNTYRLRLQVLQLPGARVVLERADTCDICTAAELTEMTNLAVSALRAELLRRRPVSAAVRSEAAAAATSHSQPDSGTEASHAAVTPAVALDASVETKAGANRSADRPLWRTVAAWTALAASVAAFGTSAYYLSIHGDFVGVDSDGEDLVNNSSTYIAAGAAGGALMGVLALGLFQW